MAFSATCPTFTAEETQAEMQRLSAEEHAQLREDLHGGGPSIRLKKKDASVPTQGTKAALLTELEEAIKTLSPDDTKAYLEAYEQEPSLVEKESNPLLFLRDANGDCPAAAGRLAGYWKLRSELFGPTAYLSPMTQDGAMAEYRGLLEMCTMTVAPAHTNYRRQSFHMHRNRQMKLPGGSREIYLRMFFYFFQKMASSEQAEEGCVLIFNVKNYALFEHWDRTYVRKCVAITKVMPMPLRAWHFCSGSGPCVTEILLPVFGAIVPANYRHRIQLHSGSDVELIECLNSFGVPDTSVPTHMGGAYTDESFLEWLSQQRQLEHKAGDTLVS